MTETNKANHEKSRYEAPVLLPLGEAVRGISVCEGGSSPSGDYEICSNGEGADITCNYGLDASDFCTFGDIARF